MKAEEFKPYVPDETSLLELTWTAVVLGVLQGVLFGVADAYLALKLGLTVGASIPAAVISMSIMRGVLKRNSILENNLVQNMASVGESLAAGATFTVPALFLLQNSLQQQGLPVPFTLSSAQVYFIICMGGLMGIFFMIPMRRYLIVKEHGRLRYPEGTACAEVLIAGDKGGASAVTVFAAMLVAAGYRMMMNALGLFKEIITIPMGFLKTQLSFDLLPSLMAVGFILNLETCALMLSGALFGWFVIIPAIAYFGQGASVPLPPAEALIAQMSPDDLHKHYLRFIGAGAVAFGGLVSLCRALPTIGESIGAAFGQLRGKQEKETARTAQDLPLPWVLGVWVLIFVLVGLNTSLNLAGFLGAALTVFFAFFFVTVSSRIVGLVGTTSLPLSGMTIGALLITCLVMKSAGYVGAVGITAAMVVATMVCIAISMGGDISQDLKIGFLVGATPKWVQLTQVISVLVASFTVCKMVNLFAPAVVSGALSAPQANLVFLITRGVIEGTLPWVPVTIGIAIAGCVELLGIGSLGFAVGLYLPLEVTTPLVFGGLIHQAFHLAFPRQRKAIFDHGVLICSGLVAGDALVGVLLVDLQRRGVDLSGYLKSFSLQDQDWAAWLAFGALCLFLIVQLRRFARVAPMDDQSGPLPEEAEVR